MSLLNQILISLNALSNVICECY